MSEYKEVIFNNTYYIMRHGESEANVAGLVTSDPEQCISDYGLTQRGINIATDNLKLAKSRSWIDSKTIIYCSDFKRTIETAELAQQILGCGAIHRATELRERSFGTYNGKAISFYIDIWPKGEQEKAEQNQNGVESSEVILSRLTKFVMSLESQYRHQRLLLVSHGDPLQVLQAYAQGLDQDQSRSLEYIQPGEIRELGTTSQLRF